jgi:SPP1 family predicted phage head-tail adaptor
VNVNPGELRHQIQIIKTSTETDSDGYKVPNESVFHKCYAKVTNTSGAEIIKSGAEFTDVKTRFLIRYKAGINEDMYILFKDKKYDISYINNYGYSNEYLEIYADKKELV